MILMARILNGLTIITILAFMLPIYLANAATQVITGEGYIIYNCNMPFDKQREIVIDLAKQDVIDKGGYYIRSYSKVDKNILSDDDLHIVSSEIVSILDNTVTKEYDNNGVEVLHSVVQATVDSERLEKIREQDILDIMSKYNTLNAKYKTLNSEDNSLQAELNMYSHYSKAIKFQEEREYNEALNYYHKALSINPKFKEAHIGIGTVNLENNDYTQALAEFDNALLIDNRSIAAYYGKAKTYTALHDYRQALIQYNIVLTLNDNYVKGYEGRAYVYHCLGNFAQEKNDYEAARRIMDNQ